MQISNLNLLPSTILLLLTDKFYFRLQRTETFDFYLFSIIFLRKVSDEYMKARKRMIS